MGLHAPRQPGTCPVGSNFYSCNGFRVCCTIDPCNPGQTCPRDKLRGGDATSSSQEAPKSTSSKTSAATLSTITTRTSLAPTMKSVPKSTDPSTVSFVTSTTPTVTPSASEHPQPSEPTSRNSTNQRSGSSTPIAPIVGGIVGAVVLIAMCALVCACLRRRRRKMKIYQAPIYPSPEIGSDMSSQLDLTHETKMRSSWHGIQQLDSTEVTSHRVQPVELPRGFFELPAEPAVRRT